jgi:hypothetical protein
VPKNLKILLAFSNKFCSCHHITFKLSQFEQKTKNRITFEFLLIAITDKGRYQENKSRKKIKRCRRHFNLLNCTLNPNDKILIINYYSSSYFIFIGCPANPIQKNKNQRFNKLYRDI